MALEYFDGFSDYSTAQLNRNWTAGVDSDFSAGSFNHSISSGTGRNSQGSLRKTASNVGCSKTLSSSFATISVGVALKFSTAEKFAFLMFGDSGSPQVKIVVNGDGTISATRGTGVATVLGTSSAPALTSGTYFHVTAIVTIHPSAGAVTVKVNGAAVLTLTSVNTRSTANSTANQVALGYANVAVGTNTIDFSDLWIDNAGTDHGDCRVETKLPTGNGTSSQFTPSTGTNWQNVDENPATDDTDYNSDGTAGHIDGYTYPALTTTAGSIKAVMTVPILRNDAAGTVTAASLYRSGGANYFGTTNTIGSTTYNSYIDIQATDPNTSAAWTVANVNACEFGIKRVA